MVAPHVTDLEQSLLVRGQVQHVPQAGHGIRRRFFDVNMSSCFEGASGVGRMIGDGRFDDDHLTLFQEFCLGNPSSIVGAAGPKVRVAFTDADQSRDKLFVPP